MSRTTIPTLKIKAMTLHASFFSSAAWTLLMLFSGAVWAQPNLTPGAVQSERILVVGGTAHLGTGEAIENAAIGFADGFIDFVGAARDVDRKRYDRVVEADGQHIYPGFIAPNSTLGLMEVAAVRASRDYQEVGTFKPNVRSVIAYNAASDITPTVRTNGVLMGQITPRGGVIGGSSSVVQFDAWNWEDAVVRADDGIHLYWPSTHHKHFEDGRAILRKRKTYDQQFTRSGTSFLGAGHTRPANLRSGTCGWKRCAAFLQQANAQRPERPPCLCTPTTPSKSRRSFASSAPRTSSAWCSWGEWTAG